MAAGLITLFVLTLCVVDGARLKTKADNRLFGHVGSPSSHTPIGLTLKLQELNSFYKLVGHLGQGGQATVFEALIGDAAQLLSTDLDNLKSLRTDADTVIAADDFNSTKIKFGDLLNFIDHQKKLDFWGHSVTLSEMKKTRELIQELVEIGEAEVGSAQASAETEFGDTMDSIERKANPYVPDFRALKGQRVAAKIIYPDYDDDAMLIKEVVFGHVLRSVTGNNYKVGGYLGFFCLDTGEPATNSSEDKAQRKCFSRFCPYGAIAVLLSEKFPGDTVSNSAPDFENAEEATAFVKSVTDAVSAMHAHGVVHGDLASRNVMFKKPNTFIIDMGYSTFCSQAHLEAARAQLASAGLFKGVLDSPQCHYRDGSQSMLAVTPAFDYMEDSKNLKRWLPEVVVDNLTENSVITQIPAEDCRIE